MKKLTALILTVLCIICLCTLSVSADDMIAPYSYSFELQNGNLIFYMTPSYSWYEPAEGEALIESGLYSKNSDGSLENIYKIGEEYFYEHDLIISSDGMYFAVIPWADSDTVITFYKNGEIQKSYTSQELMKDIKNVQHTASHYFWENSEKRSFDDATNELSITTLDKMEYTFDLTSGTVVSTNNKNIIFGDTGADVEIQGDSNGSASVPYITAILISAAIIIVIAGLIVVLVISMKRNKNR